VLSYYTEAHRNHRPEFFLARGVVKRCEEQPERADILLQAARAAGLEARQADRWPLHHKQAVHSTAYLDFLDNAYAQWQLLPHAGPEVIANIHPNRHCGRYSNGVVARAGWHMADTACAIGPHTYEAVMASADVALSAAAHIAAGAREAYALCRPPGHHAFADMAGGHCYLNNTAIAAQWLRQHFHTVAILDVDVHHGNGTQGIFYKRDDVLTVSVHADPVGFYPFYWGFRAETGQGRGQGYNHNCPLPIGTQEATWLRTIERALAVVNDYAPGCLVVALGLDAYAHDPLSAFQVSVDGFYTLGTRLGRMDIPMLLVQEGGYLSEDLGELLQQTLRGLRVARGC